MGDDACDVEVNKGREIRLAEIANVAHSPVSLSPGLHGHCRLQRCRGNSIPTHEQTWWKSAKDPASFCRQFGGKSYGLAGPMRRFPKPAQPGTFQLPSSQGLPVSAGNKGKGVTQYACPLTRHTNVPGVGKPDPAKDEAARIVLFHH